MKYKTEGILEGIQGLAGSMVENAVGVHEQLVHGLLHSDRRTAFCPYELKSREFTG